MAKAGDPRLGALLTDQLEGAHVALVGFPFDEGCARNGGRPGAAQGPAAVRAFLPKMGAVVNAELGVDLSALRVCDLGDAAGDSLEAAHADLQRLVARALAAGAVPVVVGGSNDQSYPNAAALLAARGGEVDVVNVDAHFDVRPLVEGGLVHSGSPFRLLLESGDFAGTLTEFAAQGSQCSAEHAAFITERGGRIHWLCQVRHDAAGCFRSQVLDRGSNPLFVSFDVDAIRGADMPGVSCGANVGLSAEDACDMCLAAGACARVAMLDLSELNPTIEGYFSPRLVVLMIYNFLCGLSLR